MSLKGYRPGSAGYRRVTLSLFAAGVATFAELYSTQAVLLTLRFLQGVALAGFSAVALAYLREELDAGSQGRAAGLYIGGTAIGGMVGRLLSGGVAQVAGWRWAVGSVAALGVVCTALVLLSLPASRGFRPSTGGLAGAWARTRAVTTDPGLLLVYAVAALAMGGFVATYNTLGFRLAASRTPSGSESRAWCSSRMPWARWGPRWPACSSTGSGVGRSSRSVSSSRSAGCS